MMPMISLSRRQLLSRAAGAGVVGVVVSTFGTMLASAQDSDEAKALSGHV